MDYIDILMDDEDDEGSSFTPSVSKEHEAVLSRLDALASARKAARLVALLRTMLQHGTMRIDSEMIPDFLVDEVKRKQASERNHEAFSQWLNTLCIILADNANEWLELNTLAIQCRTFSTLGSAESGKAYQLARKKRAYYAKALQREQRFGAVQHAKGNATLTPYGVWFYMCEQLLHSALDARFFESLAQAEIISERAYKGAKCRYHLDVSGQTKSDYKRVIHNTGTNASAFDHLPTNEAVPARQPPKIVRKLSKVKKA